MNRLSKALVVLCALALPVSAFAIVPDPSLSSTPPCLRVAVQGDFGVSGQVIGTDGNPLGGDQVRLIISPACSNMRQCPDAATPPQFSLSTTADGSGNFSFAPEMGGCCSAAGAGTIEADPGAVALLPIYNAIGSPDNGGDGVAVSDLQVTLPDFSRFAAAFLTANTCYDYTVLNQAAADYCDGNVQLADFSIFAGTFLDMCIP